MQFGLQHLDNPQQARADVSDAIRAYLHNDYDRLNTLIQHPTEDLTAILIVLVAGAFAHSAARTYPDAERDELRLLAVAQVEMTLEALDADMDTGWPPPALDAEEPTAAPEPTQPTAATTPPPQPPGR